MRASWPYVAQHQLLWEAALEQRAPALVHHAGVQEGVQLPARRRVSVHHQLRLAGDQPGQQVIALAVSADGANALTELTK